MNAVDIRKIRHCVLGLCTSLFYVERESVHLPFQLYTQISDFLTEGIAAYTKAIVNTVWKMPLLPFSYVITLTLLLLFFISFFAHPSGSKGKFTRQWYAETLQNRPSW